MTTFGPVVSSATGTFQRLAAFASSTLRTCAPNRRRSLKYPVTALVQVALLFLFFHKRLCGPLANSRFHHQPDAKYRPHSQLEAAYHRADKAINQIVELLAAA